VKNHLFHIFEKLGIFNRVELALYAVSDSKRALISDTGSLDCYFQQRRRHYW
jgi:hypothetical protein